MEKHSSAATPGAQWPSDGELGQLKSSDEDDTIWYFKASHEFLGTLPGSGLGCGVQDVGWRTRFAHTNHAGYAGDALLATLCPDLLLGERGAAETHTPLPKP